MPVPTYAKIYKKKISLQITYLQDDKVYTSDYHYEVATSETEEMGKNSKKIREDLRLIVDDIYKQLNDKSSEYIYIQEPILILNKRDFLNCNVVIKEITE